MAYTVYIDSRSKPIWFNKFREHGFDIWWDIQMNTELNVKLTDIYKAELLEYNAQFHEDSSWDKGNLTFESENDYILFVLRWS